MKKSFLGCVLALICTVAGAQIATGNKNIPLVIGYTSGGLSHNLALGLQTPLMSILDSNVVIEFKPGASGHVALQYLMASRTPMLFSGPLVTETTVNQTTDLKPLIYLGSGSSIVFGKPGTKAKTLKELVNDSSIKTISICYASSTNEAYVKGLAKQIKNTEIVPVPFKGAAECVRSVIGGHVDLGIVALPTLLPLFTERNIVPLVNLNDRRSPMLPDVSTVAEQGMTFDGWHRTVSRYVILGNQALDNRDTDRIKKEMISWLQTKDGQAFLRANELNVTPDAMAQAETIINKTLQ